MPAFSHHGGVAVYALTPIPAFPHRGGRGEIPTHPHPDIPPSRGVATFPLTAILTFSHRGGRGEIPTYRHPSLPPSRGKELFFILPNSPEWESSCLSLKVLAEQVEGGLGGGALVFVAVGDAGLDALRYFETIGSCQADVEGAYRYSGPPARGTRNAGY